MRNLLIAIGIILALLVGALIVVPRLIGTAQLTAFLTERLRTATGYDVAIRGPVALSVLPSPSLSVADFHVTAPAAGGAELVSAASLDVEVALMPLFSGRVEVNAVTLRDPVVTLAGPLKGAKPVEQAPPPPGAAASAPQAAAPSGAPAAPGTAPASTNKFSIAVRHVRVTNGSLSYRAGSQTYAVDKLDLDLTTAGDGSIIGAADTDVGGDKLHVTGRVGAIDCAGPIPLSFHATAEQGASMLDFAGTFDCGAGRALGANGKIKLAADSARAAVAPFVRTSLPPALDRHVALDGMLAADATGAVLSDLALDLDQTHGAGSLSVRLGAPPSIDLALDVNRLDLAAWLMPPTSASAQPAAGSAKTAVAAPAEAPGAAVDAAAKGAPGVAAALADLHVGLDLSAELVSWHGGLIRQARFNGGLDQGNVTINQATAELPGGTDLTVSGQIANALGAPSVRFTGSVDAETDNLRALADWAGLRFDGVPADRLRQASLSTSLELDGDRASASGMEFDLDGSRFRGAANLVLGGRPAIGLRLVGDQLNLDAYLGPALAAAVPTAAAPQAPTTGDAGTPPTSQIMAGQVMAGPAVAALLPLVAANVDLSVDSVTWRGQLLKRIHLAGAIENGGVDLREARIGDLGGGAITLSGRWSGGWGPATTLSGRIAANGPTAAPVLSFLGFGGRETAARLGPYGLDLRAEGSPGALDIEAAVTAEDGRATAKGRLDLAAAPHFTGTATLDEPEATRLLTALAPLYHPAGGTLGALALSASLDADPDRVALDQLALSVGPEHVEGAATVMASASPPRLDADLTAGDLVLDPLLPVHEAARADTLVRYAAVGDAPPPPGRWSREKLDVSWLGLIDATIKMTAGSATYGPWRLDKPELALDLKGGTLTLSNFSGDVLGGKMAVHGSLARAPQPTLALTLSGSALDLKSLAQNLGSSTLTGGTGALDADLSGAGGSEAELIAALGGKMSLSARNGAVTGLDLNAINERLKTLKGPQDLVGLIQAAQAGGTTAFSTLDATATVTNGVVRSNDLRLVSEGGTLTGTVTADLPAWTVDGKAQLALAGRTDLPPLAMSFSGPLDRPEKRIDVNTLAAYVQRQGVGNLLQGLTGQQPAQPGTQPQQPKPAQQLRDLFKGLGQKP